MKKKDRKPNTKWQRERQAKRQRELERWRERAARGAARPTVYFQLDARHAAGPEYNVVWALCALCDYEMVAPELETDPPLPARCPGCGIWWIK